VPLGFHSNVNHNLKMISAAGTSVLNIVQLN